MTSPLEAFGHTSDVLVWEAVLLTFVSLGVGVLGGFVGLALGSMRLPALLLMGIATPTAAGINILVSSLSALTGAVRHLREGRVDMRVVLVMGVPSMAGAFVGGFGSSRVPESALILVVALLVLWQGVELIRRARIQAGSGPGQSGSSGNPAGEAGSFRSNRLVVEGGIGLGVSLLGGAVGLILGTIRLPALLRILRLDPRVAAGTNLFIGFIMGSMGWVGHLVQGDVDYPLLVLMAAGAMVGSYFGAKFTGRVSLEALIATTGRVMVVVGIILLWQAFR